MSANPKPQARREDVSAPSYRVVDRLEDTHRQDLVALFQNEWWSKGRTLDDVRRMLDNTDLVFGLVAIPSNRLVGFARVLTDRVYRATLFDVIVPDDQRGQNFGRMLMETILAHPDLRTIESFDLHCRPELERFYEKWGFQRDTSGTSRRRRSVTKPKAER